MVVQAEGDVIGSNLGARQPDTATVPRVGDRRNLARRRVHDRQSGFTDIGDGSGAAADVRVACARRRQPAALYPINAGPHHWVLDAAFHDARRVGRDGDRAAIGARRSTSPVDLAGRARPRRPGQRARRCALAPRRRAGRDARRAQHRARVLPALRQHDAVDHRAARRPSTRSHADFVDQWSTSLDDRRGQRVHHGRRRARAPRGGDELDHPRLAVSNREDPVGIRVVPRCTEA